MLTKKSFLFTSLIIAIFVILTASPAEARPAHAITDSPDNKLKRREIQGNQLGYNTEIKVTNHGAVAPTIFGVDSASGELVNFDPWTGTENKRIPLPSISVGDTDIGLAGSLYYELYYINGDYDPCQVYVLDPNDASIIRQFRITDGHGWGVDGLAYQSGTPDSYLYTSGCSVGDMHRYIAVDGASPDFDWGNSVSVHGAVGGDDYGRIFAPVTGQNQIVEVDPLDSSWTRFFPCVGPNANNIVGMAYDGTYLYVSTLDNWVYVLNADTGVTINETQMDYTLYALAAPTPPYPVLLEKFDDVNDGNCVGPGDYITYTICYSYPNEPNLPDINDVNIIDYLPPEVDFNSASGPNYAQSDSNMVVWDIGTLSPGDANCVTLKVKVKCPEQGGVITNLCEMRGNRIHDVNDCEYTNVCCCPTLTKQDNVPDDNCVGPGNDITYSICYAANGYGDTNVVIIDDLPPEVNFVSASDGGDYHAATNTVTWDINTLETNESGCVTLTVKVGCVEPESIIINQCTMAGDCIPDINAFENTPVCGLPTLSKVDDVNDGDYAHPCGNIIYSICYNANGYGDTNVVITDYLPPEVNYVSSDPCGILDSNTISWDIGTLMPNDSNCITLTVKVKYTEQSGVIINCCEMTGDCIQDINDCEYTEYKPGPCRIIYVDKDANDSNNIGTSWPDAYNHLQDALNDADTTPGCEEIWVAEGTYKPDCNSIYPNGTGDRTATFGLINNVAIYGGFSPGSDWEHRNPNVFKTILSGDLDGNDVDVNDPCDLPTEPTRAENSYHVVTGSDVNETAILDGFTITAGNANGPGVGAFGGGMYNNNGSPTITDCNFSENSAENDGGGIYNRGSNPTITNCTFSGNSAGDGGGIYNGRYYGALSEPNILNCIFIGNSAESFGGGMYNDIGNPTITDCNFSGNEAADSGGGMAGSGTLTNCTFNGNMANSGSGMSGSGTLINCMFCGNSAEGDGGGFYNSGDSVITSCTFSGNVANANGGGIYNNSTFSGPTITNCAFSGNSANSGGGIYSDPDSQPTLTNCTFRDNSADANGGGIYNYGNPKITNCIFWDDWAANDGNEIYNYAGAEPNFSYCDIKECNDSGDNWDTNLGIDGGGNIDVDPCFADDYHLHRCSPCIDVGTNDPAGGLPPTDIDDQPRIIDGDCNCTVIVDMGADEYYTYTYMEPNYGYFVLDDFERYESRDDLRAVWKDGYVDMWTGSNITLSTEIDPRYYEYLWNRFGVEPPGPIYEGKDALQFVYDNDAWVLLCIPDSLEELDWRNYYYSEIEVNIADLNCISDWVAEDIKLLSLHFYGDPCNAVIGDANQMYFAVEDGDGDIGIVKYGDDPNYEDMNDLIDPNWQQWNIDLQRFVDANDKLDLDDVNKVYIGFGIRGNDTTPGGYGIVYFDSIRLLPPMSICKPEFGPTADFTCDCIVNFRDFCVMANEWYETDCVRTDLNEDDKVDFKDLAKLVDEWLKIEGLWPDP